MTTTKRSNFSAALRTTLLLAGLGGLLVVIGALIGGPQGALGFLVFALLLNLVFYWFSDKIALRAARAQPVSEEDDPRLYQMVRELTTRAGLPMPKLYVIPQEQPNAFATGRNPSHSAVAVTAGIRKLLSEDELRGVLAHELGHVRNHDILLTSVASAIGSAITWIAYTLLWFGGDNDSPLGAVGAIALVLLAPLAAGIIQMAISRQREFSADATGAEISGNPESLASALLRLEAGSQAIPMQVNQAQEPLYIVKPFSGGGFASLFSTHPPIEERVRRLRQMRPDHRVVGISGSEFEGRLLASLEPDGVENTDLASSSRRQTLGARLWRLHPGQASHLAPALRAARALRPVEGMGRMRIGDESVTLEPLSAVLVEPDHMRQLFNDTEADALWLVMGAPRQSVSSTLEMTQEQLAAMYPDGPKALPAGARRRAAQS